MHRAQQISEMKRSGVGLNLRSPLDRWNACGIYLRHGCVREGLTLYFLFVSTYNDSYYPNGSLKGRCASGKTLIDYAYDLNENKVS